MKAGLFDRAEQAYKALAGTPFDTDATGATIALDAFGNPTAPYTTLTFPPTGGSPTSPTAILSIVSYA